MFAERFYPLLFSIDQNRPHAGRYKYPGLVRLLQALVILLLFLEPALPSLPEIRIQAESISYGDLDIRDARGELSSEGAFRLSAGAISHAGLLENPRPFAVEGSLEKAQLKNGQGALQGRVRTGPFDLGFELGRQGDDLSAALTLAGLNITGLRALEGMPPQLEWVTQGILRGKFDYSQPADMPGVATLSLDVSGLGFDSTQGRFAGESLSFELQLSLQTDRWDSPGARGSITSGELLLDDFYRNFSEGGLEFALSPRWGDSGLSFDPVIVTDNASLHFEGRAEFGSGRDPQGWKFEINRLDLRFPGAYTRYLEPVAAAWALDGLGVSGQVTWSGQWASGQFRAGDLTVREMSIVDTRRQRFAFTGLDAHMRPGDYLFDSKLSWRGLLLGRINLGAGEVMLDSEPGKFAIVRPLMLEVLGGRVNLRELVVLLPGTGVNDDTEPDIRMKADIEELDMEQLTSAFGWPAFSGKISGEIPGVRLEDEIIDIDGTIRVNVFDGLIRLQDLRIERPFGVLPSLAGNIEAENLDLELLTETFSFGQIAGRIDGYVNDLRMLDWKPVAFDAWFGTPVDQQGSRNISRKAVNRLTALGGGATTAALANPLLRLFNKFSYKRLGLGCSMQNNICDIRGVSEDDESVLIMEGAGVPKITIRAFNRRVDWPQLLAQLLAASEAESIRTGDPPMN
jgi:hypothetical protein